MFMICIILSIAPEPMMTARHTPRFRRQSRRIRPAPATLGEVAANGLKLWAWCNSCSHNTTLEVAALIARLGRNFPVPGLGARLRCGACGGRDIDARPQWPRRGVITSHRWRRRT
jgi:hypothetical protein